MAADLLQGLLAAVRGDTAGALAVTDELGGPLRALGPGALVAMTDFVRATALLADGAVDEAYEAMRAVEAIAHADEVAAIHPGTAPAYIDAARCHRPARPARAVVGDLEDLGARFRSPTLDATIAYVRPLVAVDDAGRGPVRGGRPGPRGVALPAGPLAARPTARGCGASAGPPTPGPRSRRPRRRATTWVPRPWADRARRELRAAGESSPGARRRGRTPSRPRSWRSPGWLPRA